MVNWKRLLPTALLYSQNSQTPNENSGSSTSLYIPSMYPPTTLNIVPTAAYGVYVDPILNARGMNNYGEIYAKTYEENSQSRSHRHHFNKRDNNGGRRRRKYRYKCKDKPKPVENKAEITSNVSPVPSSFSQSANTVIPSASPPPQNSASGTLQKPAFEPSGNFNPSANPFGMKFKKSISAFSSWTPGDQQTDQTYCGHKFDRTAGIASLHLAEISKAYGSSTPVTYYSNEKLWRKIVDEWCGAEMIVKSKDGIPYYAVYGCSNVWYSIDLSLGLFNRVAGTNARTMAEVPKGIINSYDIEVEFTGRKFDLSKGYPYVYPDR